MEFVTNEKLTIVGAAGMIGSNMAQTAIMMGLTPNICLYDPYAPGLEGVAEELYHCGFEGVNVTFTSDIKEALTGAKYIVNSGGAARKAGMTREDLLKGNAAIAEEFGKNVKQYCPDVKHIVVIFNPADITGLITLLYSGLKPSQVTTLAALDSTRLRSELAKHFGVSMDAVENCRTYGGHGEQMAVFASTAKVNGKPLIDMIGTDALTNLRAEKLMERSKKEEEFRKQYEEKERYNLTAVTDVRDAAGLIFYRPLRGVMSAGFNPEKRHFGIDLTASPNESILAALDGTVIMAAYTAEWGYVIQIQHPQNFISVYKHCGSLMKREGEQVKGGEVIALVGKSTEDGDQPHLHFELWHRGNPTNPEKYVVF